MILTCPECGTNYVVKDGAIPAGGRKVRCAACKHSWHQDPDVINESSDEVAAAPPVTAPEPVGGEPGQSASMGAPQRWEEEATSPQEAIPEASSEPVVEEQAEIAQEAFVEASEPNISGGDDSWQMVDTGSSWRDEPEVPFRRPVDVAPAEPETVEQAAVDEEFDPFYPSAAGEEATARRWPWILLIILLIAAAAAAFWYFAPAAMKQQVGLSQGRSPLEVMSINNSRQALASGNDLFTVSGRIINPTQTSQPVPPLRAELLDDSKSKVIHSWMISPPVDTLAPNESRSFHSAEMDVPEGGKYLRVRLSTRG